MSEFSIIWKALTAGRKVQPSYIFLLHDLLLDRDPRGSSFSMKTNKLKLANGQRPWEGVDTAAKNLYYALKQSDSIASKLTLAARGSINVISAQAQNLIETATKTLR